ncbi:glycosyl hydrolase [Streptomyces sp. MP131-18]|uniref:glycoside hydrolase family 26 protein n=1 Tax=Streptomyces sp. MP131-18 TaxID=1857892 RepID=UPI0009A1EB57|nr:glycosyl hydrolase [Streptomyces sp. MP131-18]ONK15478.1 Mannan endo-1,4-beta-mannosidase A and B precursor [Streptomyces sp. MP131-18]
MRRLRPPFPPRPARRAPRLRTALAVTALLAAVPVTAAPAAAGAAPQARPAFAPATPGDVLAFLDRIGGSATVTGQHNKEPNSWPSQYTAQVHETTGRYPGLWGGDFLFAQADVENRQTMTDQAVTEWTNGSLTTLTWHVCPPTRGSSCGWDAGTGVMDRLSDAQWQELITEGTALNRAWLARLDEAVPYLRQLADAGVPVLFRPLHEMNEAWAWWGGRPGPDGSSALYRITHDHLAGTRALDNLIWVWNVKDVQGGAGQVAEYYPGDAYVDVVSLDAWMNHFPPTAYYDALRGLAGDKPLALAEVGRIPGPAELAAQPEWTYFMVWSEHLRDPAFNTPERIRATYEDERSLSQGQFGLDG